MAPPALAMTLRTVHPKAPLCSQSVDKTQLAILISSPARRSTPPSETLDLLLSSCHGTISNYFGGNKPTSVDHCKRASIGNGVTDIVSSND